MNFNIPQQFRQELYGCFKQSRNALFNLADALLTETTAHSVIELSLSPHFERKWPSCMPLCNLANSTRPALNKRWLTLRLAFGAKIAPARRYKVVKKSRKKAKVA